MARLLLPTSWRTAGWNEPAGLQSRCAPFSYRRSRSSIWCAADCKGDINNTSTLVETECIMLRGCMANFCIINTTAAAVLAVAYDDKQAVLSWLAVLCLLCISSHLRGMPGAAAAAATTTSVTACCCYSITGCCCCYSITRCCCHISSSTSHHFAPLSPFFSMLAHAVPLPAAAWIGRLQQHPLVCNLHPTSTAQLQPHCGVNILPILIFDWLGVVILCMACLPAVPAVRWSCSGAATAFRRVAQLV